MSRNALALALVLVLFAWPARADAPREAAEFFRAAQAAYERGEFRAAALAFEEANTRSPHGAVQYNAGLAWQAAGEAARAADDYALAMNDPSLDAPSRDDAQKRFDSLRDTIAVLRVTSEKGSTLTVEWVRARAVPCVVHLAPGEHDLVVRTSDGRSASMHLTSSAGSQQDVAIDVPAPAPPPPPPPPQPQPLPHASPVRTVGWITAGAGVVLAGAAIGLGLATLDAKSSFDASGHIDGAAHDRAVTMRTLTNVAWISAGVLAATGIILVLAAPKQSKRVTAWMGSILGGDRFDPQR